jgi:RNA-directed DNA polymerase
VVHCHNEEQAQGILEAIRKRLQVCKLRLNETKTQIVYCKDYRKKEKQEYKNKFDFLGFSFKPTIYRSKREEGGVFLGYGCSMSQKTISRIVEGWRKEKWHRQSDLNIHDISIRINPQLRGLINYFGTINSKGMHKLVRGLHFRLAKWAMNKYKRLGGKYGQAFDWLRDIKASYPNMFYHWTIYNWI